MKRSLLKLGLVLATSYLGICLLMFFSQRSFIYHPTPPVAAPAAATMTLDVPGATLQLAVQRRPGSKALIYFGGNAEDVSRSLGAFAAAFPDHAIYMLHYRSYGGSSGTPSEKALHDDAQALFAMVHAQHPDIAVLGRSLGSAVAVRLAANQPVSRLILVTPFDSVLTLAKRQFPFLPVKLLLKDKFESWRHAPQVTAPTLIVAAAEDEIVPGDSTRALLAAFAPDVARMEVLASVGHNSISTIPAYMEVVAEGQ